MLVLRWQLELYDRLAGLHRADIRESEVEMEKRARAVRVQQVMVVYWHQKGSRLPAPRSAIWPPKRSVCVPPGKYARTYETSAMT